MTPDNSLLPGRHRPIYLWAGPGTSRMNRLKFMGAPNDDEVHLEAHTARGARRVAAEAGFNWAYLMYDWGFPPEVEQADWQSFREAVAVYHAAGVRVFGYVQASNYVVSGSFARKDWYAHDPHGRPFYYYTGRYMSCWLHPEWQQHLESMVTGVVDAGADGVFFDNPWMGCQPFLLGDAWLGPAGCYCARCREAYRLAAGQEIPTLLSPGQAATDKYLRWRAHIVTTTLSSLAALARRLRPEVLVSANDYDAVMRPSYLIYGIDLAGLARVQDTLMIEDFALPRWENGPERTAPLLINNVLTLHTARALAQGRPVCTDPYDHGIGFDGLYPPRRFQQGMAEAAACGAPMVVKGTEFVEGGTFTLLTAEMFAPQRQAIGQYHRWLAEHSGLYVGRENAAAIGLLEPGEALWQDWPGLAPLYFGVGQALLAAGLPWRVIAQADQLSGLQTLLTFGPAPFPLPGNLKTVDVPQLGGWARLPPSYLARHDLLRRLFSTAVTELYRAYFRFRWARWLLERLGLVRLLLESPHFRLPPSSAQQALLAAIGTATSPRVRAQTPVLIEHWRQGPHEQVHLVNYAAAPQPVVVEFGRTVRGRVLSPDQPETAFEATLLNFALDVLAVVEFE